MGWLAAQGALMAIGIGIGIVCTIIGLFFGHIILFDSIALGIVAGVCCNQFLPIHPALCTWPQAAARTEEDLRFTMGNLLRFMAALRR